jgi:hypothetical protein
MGFGLSTYAQKEDEIRFPMALFLGPTKSDSTRIAETSLISRVQLIQELSTLKLTPKLHTIFNSGVLGLLGKRRT